MWSQWYPTDKILSYQMPYPLLERFDEERGVKQYGCYITHDDPFEGPEYRGIRFWLGPLQRLEKDV